MYNINLLGKIISMLIKGQKMNYSSLHKRIDGTNPLKLKPKPLPSKAPSPLKPRQSKPIELTKAVNQK